MKVTVLDTGTGQTRISGDKSSYEWTEGNWSCDCNRAPLFGDDIDDEMDRRMREEHPELLPHQSYCYRCKRFIVIGAETNRPDDCECTLSELNAEYDDELLKKYGIVR